MNRKYTHESQIQKLINDFRKDNGISPTMYHEEMSFYAEVHNKSMLKQGVFCSTYDKLKGGELYYYGKGSLSPKTVIEYWKNNEACRKWLLDDRIEFSAVNILKTSNDTYVTWSIWDGMPIDEEDVDMSSEKTWKDNIFIKYGLKPILWIFTKLILFFLAFFLNILYAITKDKKLRTTSLKLANKLYGRKLSYENRSYTRGDRSDSLEYYHCTKCNYKHKVYSEIGRKHKNYAEI